MIHYDAHEHIFGRIVLERIRQERLRVSGKFAHGPESDDLSNAEKLAVLVEEVGEVARAVCEAIPGSAEKRADLEEELIQVAALAVGWLEGLLSLEYGQTIPAPKEGVTL